MAKRLLLARSMERVGITRLLELFRARPGLLVINHHRIGDAVKTRFDRAMFTASTDELDQQVQYIKRRFPIIGADQMEELVRRKKPLDRLYVGITFDDGYLDNFTHAFPVLKAHGCCGVFFVIPAYMGTNVIPWWDAIAYLIRHSRRDTVSLSTPVPLTVPLAGDREDAIYRVLQHYKRPDNVHTEEFMKQLKEETGCELPEVGRRFLDWREAKEMHKSGMSIGSHTCTHQILAQLSPEEQLEELTLSRSIIQERLGSPISSIAYPVGIRSSFTPVTENLAEAAGYQVGFSFFGGMNQQQNLQPFNVKRTSLDPEAVMFRNQMVFMTRLRKLPYV